MHRPANPGKPRRLSKLRPWLAAIALGLAGCSTAHHASTTLGDPLLGPAPPPAQSTSPLHATTPGNSLPPIPQNAGLSTNAALASQTAQPQSLAITQGSGWARKVDGAGTPTTPGMPVSQPKVEPIPSDRSITAPQTPAIKQTGWSASGQPTPPSTEQLDQQLTAKGVLAHELVRDPNGMVRLKVAVANPSNPNVIDNLEQVAPDYATAVVAIIRDIDARRAAPK